MIRRFTQIAGVGAYTACRPPQVQFEPMSLLYGENCYGKSTLCDILRSLAENNPDYITQRASVPPLAGGQTVQVCMTFPGQAQETPLTFRQGAWNPVLPPTVRIEVFDTDFIHRNLFTGLTIERQNHENITRFILGETGVRAAQRIADINSELRTDNRALRDAEAGVFAGIPDVLSFIRVNEPRGVQVLDQLLNERCAELESDRRLAQGLAAARNRIEPSAYNSDADIESLVDHTERCLASTYQQAHLDAEARLTDHLQNHTRDHQRARNWVRQGASLASGNDCPFCGQALTGAAGDLIRAYQSVFDEAFERYVADTLAALDAAQRGMASIACGDMPLRIEQNRRACALYPEVLARPALTEHLNRASALADDAIHQHSQWAISHADYSRRLAEAIQHKRENAHAATPAPDAADILRHRQLLVRAIETYNEGIRPLIAAIAEFKAGLDAATVERRIQESERDIATLRIHKRRIETDAACRTYSEMSVRKAAREAECARLQVELEREQTAFLTRCFGTINRIYAAIGSSRFTISAETSRRGNMPTIQLRVAYNRTAITPDRLHRCFSESDRRALAFAIFWARIEMRDPAERANTIVVMDDPVTSFDDARIDRTIRMVELQAPHLRQIIVLSHYSDYLKAFFNRLHGQHNGVLLATLFQDANGSQMRRADPVDFTETDHQRAYRRISTFIQREHTNDVFQDLRVYLENEVRSRYYMAMCDNNLRALQFAALLDELTRIGSMSPDTRRNIEPLRVTLNTDHHVWTDRSQEEKIGVATDVLRFVYEEL
jgi:hypothetical protein